MPAAEVVRHIEELAKEAVNCGFKIHSELGPGLLESVYEGLLSRMLEKRGLRTERQKPISFEFDGITYDDAFRTDILIEGELLIEVKSVERTAPVHIKQVLTYLRLTKLAARPPDEFRYGDLQGRHPAHRQQPRCRQPRALTRPTRAKRITSLCRPLSDLVAEPLAALRLCGKP
jgi:iron complex transport system substrate-binding protein